MIEVIVTSTNYIVSATEVSNNITVTSDNTLFTVTSVVSNFTVTNVTPVITFDTEGFDFDFATKHRGEWVNGAEYSRNDVVRYEYSIYICQIPYNELLTSTTPPPQDTANWELFVFNEWPRAYLTITNWLNVGGNATIGGNTAISGTLAVSSSTTIGGNITVAGTATIGGNLNLTGDITADEGAFRNLAVSNQFSINGLNYPISRGFYGQVLSTNGTSSAYWVNLGDLVFWNLSSDLQTNGFNIVTGKETGVPNPQLTIGSGETGQFSSYIQFAQNTGNITVDAPRVRLQETNASTELELDGGEVSITGDVRMADDLYLSGKLYGDNQTTFTEIGYGLLFPDGTYMTSTNITIGSSGTFSVPIASADRLGVIRVGQYLQIDPDTGILSVDANELPSTYSLPAASTTVRGGIRVGNGLEISDTDVLNVSTSTPFGNVSLTEDMLTNGYLIRHGAGTDEGRLFLDEDALTLGLNSVANKRLVIENNVLKLEHPTLIDLKAPNVRVGSDIYNSDLQVSRIYNYSGVGPPLFPAGVQFGDQTVQITAYDDGRFDNGDITIPFNNRSWQELITYLIGIDFIDPNLVWTEPDLG